jgi:hypothetical protein
LYICTRKQASNTTGIEIAVRRSIVFSTKALLDVNGTLQDTLASVWGANIQFLLLRCAKASKILRLIKGNYGVRQSNKRDFDEVCCGRPEGIHDAKLQQGSQCAELCQPAEE